MTEPTQTASEWLEEFIHADDNWLTVERVESRDLAQRRAGYRRGLVAARELLCEMFDSSCEASAIGDLIAKHDAEVSDGS